MGRFAAVSVIVLSCVALFGAGYVRCSLLLLSKCSELCLPDSCSWALLASRLAASQLAGYAVRLV